MLVCMPFLRTILTCCTDPRSRSRRIPSPSKARTQLAAARSSNAAGRSSTQQPGATAISTPTPSRSSPPPSRFRSTSTTARSKTLLPREAPVATDSFVDLLRSDPSLNVQARGPEGVQADLSMRGTTFEQSLVLVNGLRVNDPETGHLNLDIPVPLDAITRIDVLHGSGSTFYGSDAIGGAVNLLTGPPAPGLTLVARSGAGSFGSLENHLRAAYSRGPFAEQVTASRDQSDGFMFDRNYASNAASSETWFNPKPGTTDILLAASDRPYGANNFYGNYPRGSAPKPGSPASISSSATAPPPASATPATPTSSSSSSATLVYENNHSTSSYEAALRRADPLGRNATLSYGLEEAGDTIRSNSLGSPRPQPGRGLREPQPHLAPPLLSLARRTRRGPLQQRLRLLAQRSRSLHAHADPAPPRLRRPRLPPAHLRRSLLLRPRHHRQPRPQPRDQLELRGRRRLDTRQQPPPPLRHRLSPQPVQRHRLRQARCRSPPAKSTRPSTSLRSTSPAPKPACTSASTARSASSSATPRTTPPISPQAISRSTPSTSPRRTPSSPGPANCPAHGAAQVTAHTQVNIVQKTTQTAYPLWDFDLSRNTGRIRPYLRLLNLANTGYTEIPFVPMQGRTIMGGMELNWSSDKKAPYAGSGHSVTCIGLRVGAPVGRR